MAALGSWNQGRHLKHLDLNDAEDVWDSKHNITHNLCTLDLLLTLVGEPARLSLN